MTKKLTRLQKSTAIIRNALATQWCYVNTDNEFKFLDRTFIIDSEVDEYKVHNKAGTVENFTNESYMDEVLAVIDSMNTLRFYNQNYDELEGKLVTVKE